jgi:hypothetical protein
VPKERHARIEAFVDVAVVRSQVEDTVLVGVDIEMRAAAAVVAAAALR